MTAAALPPGRFAGVEIGGTKVIVTLADDGAMVAREQFATTDPVETLGRTLDALAAWGDEVELAAVGIASFGPVRVDRDAPDYGHILETTKAGWTGAAIAQPFAARFGCPVGLDTDVNGAGIAEAALGAGQGFGTIVYLTLGTGVGGGVIVGGRPVHGRLHPELGHLRLRRADGDAFAGACPFHGDCVEGLVSGPALWARFGRDPASVAEGDAGWDAVASDLAELFIAIMLTLSPDRIVVGGGIGLGQPALVKRAIVIAATNLRNYIPDYGVNTLSTIVVPPSLGADAGPLGAILLAAEAARSGTPGIRTDLRSAVLRDSRV